VRDGALGHGDEFVAPSFGIIQRADHQAGFAELKAADKAKAPTERERDYIQALKAFFSNSKKADNDAARAGVLRSHGEGLREVSRGPRAAAFYALSLLGRSRMTIPHSSTGRRRARFWRSCLPWSPTIRDAHYLIHTYDKPQLAQLGLPAGSPVCADCAGGSACAAHAVAYFCAARFVAGRHSIESGFDCGDAQGHRDAYGRRRAQSRHGLSGVRLHAERARGGRAEVIEEVKAMPPMKDMYDMGYDPRTYALVHFPRAMHSRCTTGRKRRL